jgi:Ca2+-binding EF-hand superfamily protein
MQSLGLESKNPTFYQMIAALEKYADGGEVDFDSFLFIITAKLGDNETKDGIGNIFNLFDNDTSNGINLQNLQRVAKELGETMTVEELQEMLERAASDGQKISRNNFYNPATTSTP